MAVGVPTWGIHWPWLKYQQCHCDSGYEGDDCSLRQCPKGDDPETDCTNDRGNDYQKLACEFETAATKAFFQLRFTDQFGGEYDTRPIKIDTTATTGYSSDQNANSIQDALEALPNFAIPEIEIDVVQTDRKKPEIKVYFTDAHNTGKQNLLQFMPRAKCESGSQPLFRVANTDATKGDIKCTVSRENPKPDNSVYRESATKAQADATALMGTLVLLVIMSIPTSKLVEEVKEHYANYCVILSCILKIKS